MHGGKRPNAGRKKGQTKSDTAKNRTIRLTDADYAKYFEKGGVKWFRQKINE